MKPHYAPLRVLLAGFLLSATFAGPAIAAGPTFDEIMAAPDDVALNLAFARSEAEAGQLLSAAGALERVLLVQPDAHQARLFYAAVLFRLGDDQGARQQLALLDAAQLTPLQHAEKERFRRSLERRAQPLEISGQVAVGVVYEEDALGALATQLDFPSPVPTEEGASHTISARIDGVMKLGPAGAQAVYGSASAFNKSDFTGPESDFQRAEIEAGLSNTGRMTALKGGLVARHFRVLGDPYLTEYGAKALASHRLNTASTVSLAGEAVMQEFDEPADGGRDGSRIDVNLGFSHRLSARTSASVAAGYEWKDADDEAAAYDSPHIQANFDALLGRGAYLSLLGSGRTVEYRAVDPVLGVERKDTRKYLRLALGAPLSAFTAAGATADLREDIKLEGAVSYSRRDTRSPLADYESLGAELRLVWRFGR